MSVTHILMLVFLPILTRLYILTFLSCVQVCTNCGTVHTPLWRKEGGQLMCNACGIYFKNHGYHRCVCVCVPH